MLDRVRSSLRRFAARPVALALAASTTAAGVPAVAAADTTVTADDPLALRVASDPGERIALEIAIRDYAPREGDGPIVSLVGVAHLGDAVYYDALQEILDAYDLVLYESVSPSGATTPRGETPSEAWAATEDSARFIGQMAAQQASVTGTWPSDLVDLAVWAQQADARLGHFIAQASTDAWGRPYLLLPSRGLSASDDDGRIVMSWGADGRPGGDGADADVIVVATPDDVERAGLGNEEDDLQAALASALGLAFQLEAIDYDRAHFLPSDMTIGQVNDAMAAAGGSFELLEGTLAGSSFPARVVKVLLGVVKMADRLTGGAASLGMKVMMIEMLGDESILDLSMEQVGPGFGEVIIDARNQVVMDDLAAVLAREDADIETIGIFYGAAHVPDFVERLADQFDYVPTGDVQWLPAIEIDLATAPVSEMQINQMRFLMRRSLQQMQRQMP